MPILIIDILEVQGVSYVSCLCQTILVAGALQLYFQLSHMLETNSTVYER